MISPDALYAFARFIIRLGSIVALLALVTFLVIVFCKIWHQKPLLACGLYGGIGFGVLFFWAVNYTTERDIRDRIGR